jgi:HSP20 family protein
MNSQGVFPFGILQSSPSIRARGRKPRDVFDLLAGFFDEDIARDVWPKTASETSFLPALKVSETEEEVLITAELPGLDRKDFEVHWTEQGLVLRGEKKETKTSKEGDKVHFVETRYGKFERTIPIDSDRVDEEKVSADFQNGVLTVKIAKANQAKNRSKKIEVC